MARVYEISIVLPCGSEITKWATRHPYTTLGEIQEHVPSKFERGTYIITLAGKDRS